MARWYLKATGDRSSSYRLARTAAGGSTTAASHAGAIGVEVYADIFGRDCYRIDRKTWQNDGAESKRLETIADRPFDSRPFIFGIKDPKPGAYFEPGCYAGSVAGMDHVRDVIAGILLIWWSRRSEVSGYGTLYQLAKALHGPMSDDDDETTAALEWLNSHTVAGSWILDGGDLLLISEEEV